MSVTEEQLKQAVDVCAATAQTCAVTQAACERAVEEIRAHVKALKEWEKSPRKVVREVIHEVQAEASVSPPVDLTPLESRLADLEARASVPAVIYEPQAPAFDPARMAALEAAVADLRSKPQRLVPVSNVDEARVQRLEQQVSEVVQQLREGRATTSEVMGDIASTLVDRMSALETLVVESVQAPHALANQLKMTAEIMEAMDHRITAMREADQALLEMHRQASEQTAMAQGGLAAVIESLKSEMSTIASTVAHLQNRIARRDDYTAQIVRRGRG
jgi:hypothetical protein